MFDIGGLELLVVVIVALLVFDPKDVPKLFVNIGRFVGRVKATAYEFQRAMEEAANAIEMDDFEEDDLWVEPSSSKDIQKSDIRQEPSGHADK